MKLIILYIAVASINFMFDVYFVVGYSQAFLGACIRPIGRESPVLGSSFGL